MQSLGFPPSPSKIKRSNNSWQRKLFRFYFFPDLLKFCPFFNHEEQNAGFFSKEKCVYFWKYALGCIINKACEQQESEIQKLIFLQSPLSLGRWRSHPSPQGLFPRGQGREDAGFGESHGHCVGIPVLWVRMCSSTILAPGSSWVVFAPTVGCSRQRLLRHIRNTPEPPQGSANTGLCAWSQQWPRLQWLPQGCSGCAPACLQAELVFLLGKNEGNILIVFKRVWAVH